jgi:hypothetical protein
MKKLLSIFIILYSLCCFPQAVKLPVNTAGNISTGGTTCATTSACVSINLPEGTSSVSVNVVGTFSGTLNFEQSGDFGVTWVAANAAPQPSGTSSTSTTTTGFFIVPAGGPTSFRVRGSSGWSSGTASVTLTATPGVGQIGVNVTNNSIPVLAAGQQLSPLAVWTSATALNTVAIPVNNTFGFGACSVSLVQTSTITGGAAAWETSVDGVNWFTIGAIDAVSGVPVPNNIVIFQASTNRLIQSDMTGYSFMRIRLSTTITGTGSVTLASACQGLGSPSLTTAYQGNPPWITQEANIAGTTDPCQDAQVLKTHFFANITTATTTALVTPSGALNVYVCGIDVQLDSTTTGDTIKFVSGTGTACATPAGCNAGTCTATYSNAASTTVTTSENFKFGFGGGTYLSVGAGNGFCATTTVGTSPTIAVDVTAIQQ